MCSCLRKKNVKDVAFVLKFLHDTHGGSFSCETEIHRVTKIENYCQTVDYQEIPFCYILPHLGFLTV